MHLWVKLTYELTPQNSGLTLTQFHLTHNLTHKIVDTMHVTHKLTLPTKFNQKMALTTKVNPKLTLIQGASGVSQVIMCATLMCYT